MAVFKNLDVIYEHEQIIAFRFKINRIKRVT